MKFILNDDGTVIMSGSGYVPENGEMSKRAGFAQTNTVTGVSVVVVAHNEERHIEQCLRSIVSQTVAPDEILVIAHNCTDATEQIVSTLFPTVRLIPHNGLPGTAYAHMRGFQEARFSVIASIDGDAYANVRWLECLVSPLQDESVRAVGGVAIFHGNLFVWLGSYIFFYVAQGALQPLLCLIVPKLHYPIFWSTNFACRKSDFYAVGGLRPLIVLQQSIQLQEWMEDVYLSLLFGKSGKVLVAFDAVVHAQTKQKNSWESFKRVLRQQSQERALRGALLNR